MDIIKVEITKYQCPRCGKIFITEEEAIQCFQRGQIIENLNNTLKPWNWYILKDIYEHEYQVFISKIVNDHIYGQPYEVPSCQRRIVLYDYLWDQFYRCPDVYQVIEMLSPREAYKKYNLIINFRQKDYRNKYYVLSPNHKMPLEIAIEIDKLSKEIREKQLKDLYKLEKQELANKIIAFENPTLAENFSFESISEKLGE